MRSEIRLVPEQTCVHKNLVDLLSAGLHPAPVPSFGGIQIEVGGKKGFKRPWAKGNGKGAAEQQTSDSIKNLLGSKQNCGNIALWIQFSKSFILS
jgi:hypothetical protein